MSLSQNFGRQVLSLLLGVKIPAPEPERKAVLPKPLKDVFGYEAPATYSTTLPRYTRDTINDYVRSHFIVEPEDEFAKANKDYFHDLCAEHISRLPPYRQVFLLDGDRPSGHIRDISLGESHIVRRRNAFGIYDYLADSLDVKTQEVKLDENNFPVLRDGASICDTISHETAHREDKQLGYTWKLGDAWSSQSGRWQAAIEQEVKEGNTGHMLADLTGTEIELLNSPYYQYAPEALAEFEKLIDVTYKLKGDFKETCDIMAKAYPHMWPVFHDEYLAKKLKLAAQLNPHIDLGIQTADFQNEFPGGQRSLTGSTAPSPV